ncbi:MAG: ATP synthase subunit I, partial [Candidatus Hydrogenedentes bacterium]|nr:ATP synthase subunit I [Candidatus Hydrogenedentota bacterium]
FTLFASQNACYLLPMPENPDQKLRPSPHTFASARWFATATLVGTAILTLVCTAIAWMWDPAAAKGIAIGGAAGAAGFWLILRRTSTLHTIPKAEIPYRVYRWTFSRILLYGLALILAYLVDPAGRHALLGAAGGLFIARAVMMVTGIIAWRRGVQAGSGSSHE